MEHFVPGVRDAIIGLTDALRFVVFFIAVAGLILQVQRARADMESLARPLVRAVLVVGIIATLPHFHEKACRGLYIKRFTFFVAGLGPGFPLVRLPYALWVAASIGRTVQGGVLDSGKGMALLTGYRIL